MSHQAYKWEPLAVCPPDKGRKIAADAYAQECRRQGREPNWKLFDRIVGAIPNPAAEAPRIAVEAPPVLPAPTTPVYDPETPEWRPPAEDADYAPYDEEYVDEPWGDLPLSNPIADAAREVGDRIIGEHD